MKVKPSRGKDRSACLADKMTDGHTDGRDAEFE